MKKILLFSTLLFSLNSMTAKIEPVEDWSFNSACNVGLSTAVMAAIPCYFAHWCCGGIKDTQAKMLVGAAGAIGGFAGYFLAYYHTPEVRFNRALEIFQNELNQAWFTLFERAETAAEIWLAVDTKFFEAKYPRITGMTRLEGLYNSLISCIDMSEKAVATESKRFSSNEYILKHGKQMIEQSRAYLGYMKRWIIELRNDPSYLMQKNAYAAEMAANAARQAAFNSALSALNSGPHYHYHRHW